MPGFRPILGFTVVYLSLVVLIPLSTLVFQSFKLNWEDYVTVFENVAFGLRVKPRREWPGEAIIRKKVHDLLSLVQLDWLHDRFRRPACARTYGGG
jgi:hypothetical protein